LGAPDLLVNGEKLIFGWVVVVVVEEEDIAGLPLPGRWASFLILVGVPIPS